MSDEKKAVGYVRASEEAPATLEEQKASVEQVAAEQGLKLVDVIEERRAKTEQQARSARAKAAWARRRQRQQEGQ